MRRLLLAFLVCLLVTSARADAVTLREIIDLSRAGLGEESLLALIEVDGGVFAIDAATLKELKAAGVSERVIVALIRSGRVRPADAEPQADALEPYAPQEREPQVIVIDHEPEVREVAVPVPVYVGIPVRGRHRGDRGDSHDATPASPFFPGAPTKYLTDTPRQGRGEPVYWGFGGKLRPDAWKPAPKPDPDR